tara:strand:- start:1952 stop:2959 length:1008 start_codon:yes stop_codon:yes gene_type:complete
MLLSVIIPCFNVEKYIEKCILSVINNDLDLRDLEIILVDDESPDNTVSIVKNMIRSYAKIKLISQKNKGLGGARNTGVLNASGDYVLFLDADDYLKKNALKNVITFASENKLDILEYGAIGVTEKCDEVYRYSKSTDIILSGFEYLDNTNYMNSACNKLYAVSFLNNHGLRFEERIFIEDFEFNTRAFYYAKRVKAVEDILGCFVQTSNSITRNISIEKNSKMLSDIEEVIDLTIKFQQEESNFSSKVHKVFKERIAFLTTTLLFNLIKLSIDKKQCKLIIENLKLKKLYPVRTTLRNKNKNLFRWVVNNEFLFFQLFRFYKIIQIKLKGIKIVL